MLEEAGMILFIKFIVTVLINVHWMLHKYFITKAV